MSQGRTNRKEFTDGIQETSKAPRADRRRSYRCGGCAPGAATSPTSRRQMTQAPTEEYGTAAAPPPANPADELQQLAKLHASGALTDEEFAAAKAKIIGG